MISSIMSLDTFSFNIDNQTDCLVVITSEL